MNFGDLPYQVYVAGVRFFHVVYYHGSLYFNAPKADRGIAPPPAAQPPRGGSAGERHAKAGIDRGRNTEEGWDLCAEFSPSKSQSHTPQSSLPESRPSSRPSSSSANSVVFGGQSKK